MPQKVVLKVSMHTEKCRTKAMKTVVGVSGVTSAELKGDDKRQIEVKGEGIDVAKLTILLRKKVGHTDLVSLSSATGGGGGGGGSGDKKVEPVVLVCPYCNYYPCDGFCGPRYYYYII